MAGGLGMKLAIDDVCGDLSATQTLFSESNTRFLIEVAAENADEFATQVGQAGVSVARVGTIESGDNLTVTHAGSTVLDISVAKAKQAWLAPLNW